MESRRGFQRQSMFPRVRFCYIAEALIDRPAFVPIGKLVRVVGAAGLTRLAAGDEHDGLVPICEVGDETHGGAVVFRCGTWAVGCAGLRLVRDAQKILQETGAPERMHHIEGVKLFPGPVIGTRFVAQVRELRYGTVRGRNKKRVVGFVSYWQPL